MIIREYCRADESAVIKLWQRCGLVVAWNDPKKDIQRKLEDGAGFFLVCLDGSDLIGTAMGGYDGHRGWVNYLAVHPERRKEGIGRMLMKALEERLLDHGCPKLNIQVRETNSEVLSFYRSIGYKVDKVVSLGKRLIADD